MRKIYLRADGSATIGYGHVHRMLALAQMLSKKFDCTFVSHEAPTFLLDELKKLSIEFIKTATISYTSADGNDEVPFDMGDILSRSEIVVLDGYGFGRNYQKQILDKGCKLVYIDDLIKEGAIADCIVNHSLGVKQSQYKHIAAGTSIYLGAKYSLINIENKYFHETNREEIFDQLLIAMGGADPMDYTNRILSEQAHVIKSFKKVVVVVGVSYSKIDELKKLTKEFSVPIKILQGISKEEVFETMQQSSTAILSASTMAVEYAHIGGLLAIVKTAPNQQYLFDGLLENDIAISVERLKNVDKGKAQKIQENQKEIFDGKSKDRFIKLFNELQLQGTLSLIRATGEHLELTFKWASDPAIRAYSFTKHQISFEEHCNWYSRKINQPECTYLLGILNGETIGSIRFDKEDGNAIISYLIDTKFHGKGLGRILLAEGLNYLCKNDKSVCTVYGYVMPYNIASIKAFERLGFDVEIKKENMVFTKNLIC